MTYYVYLLRCEGNTLYAGICADLNRRMKEHFTADPRCAKYTKSHPPIALAAAWTCEGRGPASRLEYRLKQLGKPKKERLAEGCHLSEVLEDLPFEDYVRLTENPWGE